MRVKPAEGPLPCRAASVDGVIGAGSAALPPYQRGGADAAFYALIGLFVLGELVIRVRSSANRSGRRTETWSLLTVVVAIAAGVVSAMLLTGWTSARIGGALGWACYVAGLLLMTAGLILRQWSVHTLGRFFTVDVRVHADQEVIDTGPYRWVRHPSYTALIVFLVGVGCALDNWASLLALLVVPIIGLRLRIRSEEAALVSQLGERYRRYAEHRKRLLPGVW